MNYNKKPVKNQSVETTPRQRKLILITVALALTMVVSAVSGLNLALPSISRELGATQTQLQWIVNAYTMVFAGLLLGAGALGDRYGRKGILLTGLTIFGGAAAAASFVDSAQALIVLRAVMGVGAALTMPTTLSIITTSFPKEERGKAVGVWAGVAGGGAVLGLFGAGILLEFFSWSSFFVLNVVLAVLAFIGTVFVMPKTRDAKAPQIDISGALLSLLAVTGLVFGIIEGPERGWTNNLVLSGILGGIASLVAFVMVELKAKNPLLDPRLFKFRGFSTGSLSLTIQFFASFGFFYVIIQYLQYVADFSPLKSAFALLPLPLVLIPLSRKAPAIAERFGINRTGAFGLSLIAVGLVIISFIGVEFQYWLLAIGIVIFAMGMALAGTPATTAIVSSLPRSKQGVASAMNDLSREFGSALGIAILGSVLNDRYRSAIQGSLTQLPDSVAQYAERSISFVKQTPLGQYGSAGEELLQAAKQSYVDATGAALLTGAAVLFVGAIIVYLKAPKKSQDGLESVN